MSDELDPALYVRAPRIDVPSGIALGHQLLAAAPETLSPSAQAALNELRIAVTDLEARWAQRDLAPKAMDPRPIDLAADNAWSCLVIRLEGAAALPVEIYPFALRARELLQLLFPDRLAFTQLHYPSQWAEAQKRINNIQAHGLQIDLDRIAGPEYLAEVRRTHERYGEIVGTSQAKDAPATVPELAEPLRRLGRAMAGYGIQMVALYFSGDEPTRARVRRALLPLDQYRASAAARKTQASTDGSKPSPQTTPSTPSTTPSTPPTHAAAAPAPAAPPAEKAESEPKPST
ncbi:MAG TPA: hypothetical protein VH877_33785 [Polyangia bacterium]|nr:hypothetical protein [Polyangia bacterium]